MSGVRSKQVSLRRLRSLRSSVPFPPLEVDIGSNACFRGNLVRITASLDGHEAASSNARLSALSDHIARRLSFWEYHKSYCGSGLNAQRSATKRLIRKARTAGAAFRQRLHGPVHTTQPRCTMLNTAATAVTRVRTEKSATAPLEGLNDDRSPVPAAKSPVSRDRKPATSQTDRPDRCRPA